MGKLSVIKKMGVLVILVMAGIVGTGLSYGQADQTQSGLESSDENLWDEETEEALEELSDADEEEYDPLEPFNRVVFDVNRVVDGLLLKPLAIVYRATIPEPVRNGVGHVIDNLFSPVEFLNHLFQGRPDRANTTVFRFFINSTLGVLGLFDAAAELGIPGESASFGDTLGVWGVETGPYLMLPLLGPSSFRDTVGLGADWYINPVNYYFRRKDRKRLYVPYVRDGLDLLGRRTAVLDSLDQLEESSSDFYASVRSIYFQKRAYKLKRLRESTSPESPKVN